MKSKVSNRKILWDVFKQAIIWGKSQYVLYILIGAIIGFDMFLWIKLPQFTTDVIYTLFSEDNLDFYTTITPVLYILGGLLIFQIARNIHGVIGVRVRRDSQTHFELNLIRGTSFLPWEDYEKNDFKSKLDLVNRQGLLAFQNIAIDLMEYIISTAIYIFVYVKIISELGLFIGLVFFLLTIVYFSTGLYFGSKYYQMINKKRGQGFRMWFLFRIGENKEVHQDLIVNRGTRHIMNSWENEFNEYMDATIQSRTQMKLYLLIPNFIFSILAGWLIYTVITLVADGVYSIGYFSLVITTIISYKQTLEFFAFRSQHSKRNFEIYRDYLEIAGREHELENNKEVLPNKFDIEFNDVSYTYVQSDHKALNKLDITIKNGETIAIVGVNGSGKTTFTNLMGELTKRYDGEVIVNGDNIQDTLGVLRNSTSIIFQDFQEYQVSIKDNIRLGDIEREIKEEEIYEILKKVGLYDDVMKLPDRIDTILGQLEDGTELSKGQWQRLAVARMLAKKDAKIWILDEPTAYLDPLAEIEMYDFIYSLKEDRTVIFISHRLGFAKKADRIVVFKDGKVDEQGTHQYLMKHGGEYAKMFEKQKTWYR